MLGNIIALNAEAEANLAAETGTGDPATVTPSGEPVLDNPEGNTLAVIAEPSGSGDKTDDPEALVKQMEESQTEIATTVNNITRVHDLDEVAQQVLAQESISQSDVEKVDKAFGGFIGEQANLNEFTEAPSRVGLTQVKTFVTSKLEAEKTTTEEQYLAFISSTKDQAAKLLVYLNGFVPEVVRALDLLQEKALRDLPRASKCNRFWSYTVDKDGQPEGSPADLRYYPMCRDFGRYGIGPQEIMKENLCMAYSDLQIEARFKYLCWISGKAYEIDGMLGAFLFREDLELDYPGNYMEILTTLADRRYAQALESGLQLMTETAEAATRIIELAQEKSEPDTKRFEAITTACRLISKYYQGLTNLAALTQTAMAFANAVTPIVAAFSEVLDRETAPVQA